MVLANLKLKYKYNLKIKYQYEHLSWLPTRLVPNHTYGLTKQSAFWEGIELALALWFHATRYLNLQKY